MILEEVLKLQVGDIIRNTNTQCDFEITEVIWESRDPPEYNTKSLKDGNEGGMFFTWFAKEQWIKVGEK